MLHNITLRKEKPIYRTKHYLNPIGSLVITNFLHCLSVTSSFSLYNSSPALNCYCLALFYLTVMSGKNHRDNTSDAPVQIGPTFPKCNTICITFSSFSGTHMAVGLMKRIDPFKIQDRLPPKKNFGQTENFMYQYILVKFINATQKSKCVKKLSNVF